MKRLTNSDKEIPTLSNNAEYWLQAYFKLKDYEDSEEQGLLLKLPCKDVFYIVDKGTKYEMVMRKSIDNLNLYEIRGIDKDGYYWSTRKLAEERPKESGG